MRRCCNSVASRPCASQLQTAAVSQFASAPRIAVSTRKHALSHAFRRHFASSAAAAAASKHATSTAAAPLLLPELDTFARRHLGVSPLSESEKSASSQGGAKLTDDVHEMLQVIGYESLDALIGDTIPAGIRAKRPLSGVAQTETTALAQFTHLMSQNELYRCHLGQGYYPTITPPVILRNVIENPAWYTPYTPYQAEISQGRLEMLLNFQTLISDLTGLPVANSSLLDEATAAAEAMNMLWGTSQKKKVFLIDANVHQQTIAVCQTRARGIGLEVRIVHSAKDYDYSSGQVFGVLLQYPDTHGAIRDYKEFTRAAHAADVKVCVATDLLALTLLQPPGEWNADVVLGNAQRFGVPMGYGGPHAAFLTTTEAYKRKLPGRIIGVSRDSRGQPALRMAMQTREQHIRRDKATSNICTAQALLANTAASYAIYHGPHGLREIASKVHRAACILAQAAQQQGHIVKSDLFFDTVWIDVGQGNAGALIRAALAKRINLRQVDDNSVTVAFDETVVDQHVIELIQLFAALKGTKASTSLTQFAKHHSVIENSAFQRTTPYMTHPVFNSYHCETEMLRYLYKLSSRDLSLCTAMIPLGSCTMKLNATSEMIPITQPKVNSIHPFVAANQVKGYELMLRELSERLAEVTGFAAISLQPNAGSQGEYAGLLAIAAYHASRGDGATRNVCLIPTSAHGTNPASAVMSGMRVVVVKCDDKGGIDLDDLRAKVKEHAAALSCIMVTYPSTFGVFEEAIRDICELVHAAGGQVYMDGANMNAQVGLCSPGEIGADVCHLNLHKTFCIPHGGGGPGMGPIGVAKHLIPFLPSHPFKLPFDASRSNKVGPVAASPFSSASILPISYMYMKMMGGAGLTLATKIAILNANYMAARLGKHYRVLYKGARGTVAHEFIIDLRAFKSQANITEEDVAKRLIDFNFHAPTMSWPVVGTLMIEPTESESRYELDRLCDALIVIRREIQDIIDGKVDKQSNVLKNAPHTADMCLSDSWAFPYKREQAAYPLPYLRAHKFWPQVGRLDNVYGDRNVVCTCPPMEAYEQAQ